MKAMKSKYLSLFTLIFTFILSINTAKAFNFDFTIDILDNSISTLDASSSLEGKYYYIDGNQENPFISTELQTAGELLGLLDANDFEQVFFELQDGSIDQTCAIKNYITTYYPEGDVIRAVSEDQSTHLYTLSKNHVFEDTKDCSFDPIAYSSSAKVDDRYTAWGQRPNDGVVILQGHELYHYINTQMQSGGSGGNSGGAKSSCKKYTGIKKVDKIVCAAKYVKDTFDRLKSGPVFKSTAEAAANAAKHGYKKINERVNGQAVFKKGNRYITRDVDGHNGGAWKMADSVANLRSKSTRMGTYDANLNKIGP